ncbi:MAG: 16S rRNA (cytidine(1402)-2'-O)-methyltransferase [Spirochaetaceae bacterium]|nr:16S rRNA (cytidine(1402)-2'-O)-methyltransferase [Spirochaetaceae bacterium]|tara:strand:- start:40930 stop:41679 length:750 start_codon:yes stop_codon:yes gene_type:complete
MDSQQEWTLTVGPSQDSTTDGAALYIVATPIGNLEDVTIRALRVLNLVDEILSEDTRKTRILLQRYNIQNELKSFRVHQIRADIQYALSRLREGMKIALVTDAGTPGISDPGSHLVREVRESLPECPVVPIPGPSALSAALSVCGWQANPTVFLGFLPRKPGKQRKALEEAGSVDGVLVIYESVHRIQKTLHFIRETLPDRPLLIGREITKIHEEWVYWATGESLPEFNAKGEFVIMAGPAREKILELD